MAKWQPLGAGELRHRIAIEKPTRTTSPSGAVSSAFAVLYADVPARVRPSTAGEREAASRVSHRTTHEVRFRYLAGVTAECRVRLGSRVLSIVGLVDPDEARVELWLETAEAK